jgi:hypothetical protein
MGEPRLPRPVKLVCAVLAGQQAWLDAARAALEAAFGPVDMASDVWPFDCTDYYASEMGTNLLRRIYSFEGLVDPGDLKVVKHTTNRLEREVAASLPDGPRRPVNLDPGYVSLSKLVLATTKEYGHRVYLGSGIHAECTLTWRDGAFRPWEWTYPDYRRAGCLGFLAEVRGAYRDALARQRR